MAQLPDEPGEVDTQSSATPEPSPVRPVPDPGPAPAASPPPPSSAMTVSQVATAYGMSRARVRRHLEERRFPNASKDERGAWRIPVADLPGAGLVPAARSRHVSLSTEDLTREIDRLRAENALLRELLVATQTVAREREERIDDLRFALRMLPQAWAEKLERADRERALEAGLHSPQTEPVALAAGPAAGAPMSGPPDGDTSDEGPGSGESPAEARDSITAKIWGPGRPAEPSADEAEAAALSAGEPDRAELQALHNRLSLEHASLTEELHRRRRGWWLRIKPRHRKSHRRHRGGLED